MSCDTLPPRSSTEIENEHASSIRIAKHERCMHKVHEQLRQVNEKAYGPMLLAIGPYNDQGEVGRGFMQQHKLRYLEHMLQRTKRSEETYLEALREMSEIARKCYVECFSQTTDEFLKMMLLDGCFIIELFRKYEIYSKTGNSQDDPIFQLKWVIPIIARDLLVFENQLPFFVLAKLFGMSESSNTLLHNRSKNSGEHAVDIDGEKEGIKDLALGFFNGFLPFNCNVDASRDKSTENIKNLLFQVRECERLEIWFRFMDAEFEVEHLLGLVHAAIVISILDMETPYGRESQAQRNLPEKSKHQHGSEIQGIRKGVNPLLEKMFKKGLKRLDQMNLAMEIPSGSESQAQRNMPETSKHPQGSELQEAEVKSIMAEKLKNHLIEIHRWMNIPYAIDLQEAGIELKELEKLIKDLCDGNKNEDGKSKHNGTGDYYKRLAAEVGFKKAEKFRLRRLDRIKNKGRNIHSAIELTEAGIKFQAAEGTQVVSMKFNNRRMEISPLSVEDHTETYLRNLIAYEQYSPDNNFDYITHYVCFLDDLINSPKDVKLLRRSGIIRNYLGDDEAISTLVNKLGQNINFSYSNSIYARTAVDLNMYCIKPINRWMAEFRHDYCKSPWTLFSFLAAVLLLLLTITQTIFSVVP